MSINITCEKCFHSYDIPEKYAGKKGRCKHCGADIYVPPAITNSIDEEPPPLPSPTSTIKSKPLKKEVNRKPDGYAGIMQRFFAYIVDLAILLPIAVITFLYVISPKISPTIDPLIEEASQRIITEYRQLFVYSIYASIVVVLTHLMAWPYYAIFESLFKATLGKFVFGIYVTDKNKKNTSLVLGLCRYLAKIISLLPVGLGFLLILTNEKKQSLHDKMCHTLVFSSELNSPSIYGLRAIVFLGAIAAAISPVFLSANIANIDSVKKIKANTLFYHLIKGTEFSGGGAEDLAHQLGFVALEEIIPTSVEFYISDMLTGSDAKLTDAVVQKMEDMNLEDILKLLAFKEEIKWESSPITDENDPYAKTHFRVFASFLTQKSHPMQIAFKCAYNQQDIILFESVSISGKNVDLYEFYSMVFMSAIMTAIKDTKDDFTVIEEKHSHGLELSKTYTLKMPLYTSSKIETYNEMMKIQLSNDVDMNEKINALTSNGAVVYLDFGTQLEIIEMTPSLEYAELCSIAIQGDKTRHYFLMKSWLAGAI